MSIPQLSADAHRQLALMAGNELIVATHTPGALPRYSSEPRHLPLNGFTTAHIVTPEVFQELYNAGLIQQVNQASRSKKQKQPDGEWLETVIATFVAYDLTPTGQAAIEQLGLRS